MLNQDFSTQTGCASAPLPTADTTMAVKLSKLNEFSNLINCRQGEGFFFPICVLEDSTLAPTFYIDVLCCVNLLHPKKEGKRVLFIYFKQKLLHIKKPKPKPKIRFFLKTETETELFWGQPFFRNTTVSPPMKT